MIRTFIFRIKILMVVIFIVGFPLLIGLNILISDILDNHTGPARFIDEIKHELTISLAAAVSVILGVIVAYHSVPEDGPKEVNGSPQADRSKSKSDRDNKASFVATAAVVGTAALAASAHKKARQQEQRLKAFQRTQIMATRQPFLRIHDPSNERITIESVIYSDLNWRVKISWNSRSNGGMRQTASMFLNAPDPELAAGGSAWQVGRGSVGYSWPPPVRL